jgi:hypothetical protein
MPNSAIYAQTRETIPTKKALPMRHPILSVLRNQQKQRDLHHHKNTQRHEPVSVAHANLAPPTYKKT